jgi:hypothetical protein
MNDWFFRYKISDLVSLSLQLSYRSPSSLELNKNHQYPNKQCLKLLDLPFSPQIPLHIFNFDGLIDAASTSIVSRRGAGHLVIIIHGSINKFNPKRVFLLITLQKSHLNLFKLPSLIKRAFQDSITSQSNINERL